MVRVCERGMRATPRQTQFKPVENVFQCEQLWSVVALSKSQRHFWGVRGPRFPPAPGLPPRATGTRCKNPPELHSPANGTLRCCCCRLVVTKPNKCLCLTQTRSCSARAAPRSLRMRHALCASKDAVSFWGLASKIPPLGSTLNFDADVKKRPRVTNVKNATRVVRVNGRCVKTATT